MDTQFQIKSNQIKSNQVKSNQIKSNQIKSNQIKSNQIKSNLHAVESPLARRWLSETYLICTGLYQHQGVLQTHNVNHCQRLQNWMKSSVRCSQSAVSSAGILICLKPVNRKINLAADISTISAAKKKKHIYHTNKGMYRFFLHSHLFPQPSLVLTSLPSVRKKCALVKNWHKRSPSWQRRFNNRSVKRADMNRQQNYLEKWCRVPWLSPQLQNLNVIATRKLGRHIAISLKYGRVANKLFSHVMKFGESPHV